jgi:hypothetical protein
MMVGQTGWIDGETPVQQPFRLTQLHFIGHGWTPLNYPHTREVTGSSPVPPTEKLPINMGVFSPLLSQNSILSKSGTCAEPGEVQGLR